MLETTTLHVAPAASYRVSGGGGGDGGGGGSRIVGHSSRVVYSLVLLLMAARSTSAEPDASIKSGTGASDAGPGEGSIAGIMAQTLNSNKENAAAALSLLESLLATLESFLAEYGLPSASFVCPAVAVAILFLLFLGKLGSGSGSGKGSSKKRKGVVLFLGPCGSGKTAMCYRLSHGINPAAAPIVSTTTSMEACTYPCSGSTLNQLGGRCGASTALASLVDYPGHERLRGGVGEELRGADRVVFLLDGSCLAAQVAAGAELLYDVLTDPSIEGCRGLMLALNKSDLKEAKASRAKMLLQKELDKLRSTRGMLGTQGEEDDMPVAMALGRPGQPFNLEVDSPCEVVVASCSAVKEGGLDAVVEFVGASLR
ncbi:unnamed protein product [Hapterophycus canaliculatus]